MTSAAPHPADDRRQAAAAPHVVGRQEGGTAPLAIWHGVWAGATAVVTLALMTWAGLSGPSAIGALGLAVPGLAGLFLIGRDGPGERALVLVVWTLAALAALVLSGGLSGPLSALAFMPFVAGLALGLPGRGVGLAQAGAGGAAIAAVGGQLSAWLVGPPTSAPVVAGVIAVSVALAAVAAVRLAWGPREARLVAAQGDAGRIEALLNAQPGFTLAMDAAGRVLGAWGTPPATLTLDALAAQGLIAAVHAPDRPAVLAALERAASGHDAEVRFAPRMALDRRVVMFLRGNDALTPRLIAQAFDGTRQFAAEEGLEAARAEAEARDVGKTRFLANMSHELRTPLNAILGFSDIMRQRLFGPLSPKYADYAASIHEAGGHLLDLINDVLDVSKIEAERYELSRETFDARDAVSAAAALVRVTAQDKGVSLTSLLPDAPVTVDADRRALKQITLNLLSNAIKFTPEGGAVTLTLETIGPYLELVVSDTGVGIAARDLKRLGRPFEQAGGADQKAKGTGLGLSLVRALAELHGGRMSLDSTLGEGTAVTVRMPVAVAAPVLPEGGAEVIPFTGVGQEQSV